jgi:hypothetical protein
MIILTIEPSGIFIQQLSRGAFGLGDYRSGIWIYLVFAL